MDIDVRQDDNRAVDSRELGREREELQLAEQLYTGERHGRTACAAAALLHSYDFDHDARAETIRLN